jgi:hypothetical protein
MLGLVSVQAVRWLLLLLAPRCSGKALPECWRPSAAPSPRYQGRALASLHRVVKAGALTVSRGKRQQCAGAYGTPCVRCSPAYLADSPGAIVAGPMPRPPLLGPVATKWVQRAPPLDKLQPCLAPRSSPFSLCLTPPPACSPEPERTPRLGMAALQPALAPSLQALLELPVHSPTNATNMDQGLASARRLLLSMTRPVRSTLPPFPDAAGLPPVRSTLPLTQMQQGCRPCALPSPLAQMQPSIAVPVLGKVRCCA